ncbi:MAG: hypothetical protein HY234_13545 [Acidobacteria bacterium]|nr:hypothetical protein [Acidobacteriota bacterium]
MDPVCVPRRAWLTWGSILVLLFLALAALGWQRTLIVTETWALINAGQPFAEHLTEIRGDLVHPPLIYLVQRGWLAVFGQTDNAARALPLVIIPPAILLLTLLATRITPHWRLLSFFLASVFFHIGGAPTLVRMYGLALLLTAAGLLLWDSWRTNPRNATLAAWTAVMTLLVYTHLFGALFVVSFVMLNWLFGRRKITFTLAAAVPALAFLPWFLYVLPVYHARGLDSNLHWVHKSLASATASLFYNFLGSFPAAGYRIRLIGIALAAAIHLGLLILWWRNRTRFWPLRGENEFSRQWFWMAALFAAVPLLVLFVFSVTVARSLEARFVLGAMIPYLIVVFLLCQLSGRAGRIALLAVLLPWKIVGIAGSVVEARRPSIVRQGVEFAAGRVRPGDLLLADAPGLGSVLYWEWNRRLHRSERIEALSSDLPTAIRMAGVTPRPFDRLDLDGVSRIWVFRNREEEDPGLVGAMAARGFVPVPQGATGVPRLLLFERKTETVR